MITNPENNSMLYIIVYNIYYWYNVYKLDNKKVYAIIELL